MSRPGSRTAVLSLGALGIVFGDIGTSPLYAMREAFEGSGHELVVDEANVLGVLSLILWSLIVVITIKYLIFVMRASNQGEGGILVLASLLGPAGQKRFSRRWALVLLGLFGTALLYGDGMITPAISVLSAVEGTEVATDSLSHWVIPIAIVILVALFAVQRRGTGQVGRVFGPVMVVWFSVLAVLGVTHIVDEPSVLRAVVPSYAVEFFVNNTLTGFLALGSVFLVVTGGEALYADMGHFGRRPIAIGWLSLVLPALLLNYFGQGALLVADPESIDNPFYRLAPDWGLIPLVVLATAATVIASQALISGAFSLTMQASQLSYAPRMRIDHTSGEERGQIYVPAVNWILMVCCIGLVFGFRSSTNLAAAYGVAVTMTMAITTLLFYYVARSVFGWSRKVAAAICSAFLVVDLAFFGANIPKIPHGGWFPLVVGAVVFTLLTTWSTGRRLVGERMRAGRVPLQKFVASLFESQRPPVRAQGTAVYMFSMPGMTPPALMANVRSMGVLHERVIIASVITEDVPRVHPVRYVETEDVGRGIEVVRLHFGFMEEPEVASVLETQLGVDPLDTSYFLGRETVISSPAPGMARWRERLYALMLRNTTSAAIYFGLPSDRVFEVGVRVEI